MYMHNLSISFRRKILLPVYVIAVASLIPIASGLVFAQATPPVGVATGEQPAATKKEGSVKITFDEKDSSIMYVESNGERYQVNSVTKAVERLAATTATTVPPTAPADPTTAAAKKKDDDNKIDLYAYDAGDEPFDYRLVNVPTPKKVPKGTWNLSFNHRFSQPLSPFNESAPALLGLDSFSASSFGITYGITDKLYFTGYRSPICQKGLCRTVELGFGYHFTDQNKNSPVALSAYASVEGNNNFRNIPTICKR
jgi:hypothetical protein